MAEHSPIVLPELKVIISPPLPSPSRPRTSSATSSDYFELATLQSYRGAVDQQFNEDDYLLLPPTHSQPFVHQFPFCQESVYDTSQSSEQFDYQSQIEFPHQYYYSSGPQKRPRSNQCAIATPYTSETLNTEKEEGGGAEKESSNKRRRSRTQFTAKQNHYLEKAFNLDPYLAPNARIQLARSLQLDESQNRRAKQKKVGPLPPAVDFKGGSNSLRLLHEISGCDAAVAIRERQPSGTPSETGSTVSAASISPPHHIQNQYQHLSPCVTPSFYEYSTNEPMSSGFDDVYAQWRRSEDAADPSNTLESSFISHQH